MIDYFTSLFDFYRTKSEFLTDEELLVQIMNDIKDIHHFVFEPYSEEYYRSNNMITYFNMILSERNLRQDYISLLIILRFFSNDKKFYHEVNSGIE